MKVFEFNITNQTNERVSDIEKMSSHTLKYAKCKFNFIVDEDEGNAWDGIEHLSALFRNSDSDVEVAMLLSNNECYIPHEVLEAEGNILVHLVGFNDEDVSNENVITYRMTSFETKFARIVEVSVEAAAEAQATPSLFAQYCALVQAEVSKVTDMTVSATTLPAGSQASATKTEVGGVINIAYGIPKGDTGSAGRDGTDGEDGEDGVSPTVSTSKVGDTATITITDAQGAHTFTLTDGEDGEDGTDGVSPTVTISKSGTVTTITIVDATGTHTATINDGSKGDKGDTGDTGATGNGISSITKTGTAGKVDTYTITFTNGQTATFTVTNGNDGVDGEDGEDGYSPTASVSKVGNTSTLTVTDETGTTTTEIIDGTNGTDGEDGEDGFSPQVTTSKVGKTTTITIVDATGTHTATILDGADGQGSGDMTKAVYDVNGNGIVDYAESVPWSGVTSKPNTFPPESHTHTKSQITDFAHTHDDRYYTESEVDTMVSAKYSKPSGGIPASDLAESYISSTAKGANNGVAELDATGKIPSGQLPSFVDDVLEYNSLSDFPATGESGKIYIAKDTNITYRWGGSAYVPIGSDLALGETSTTAYRGDRGKTAYDHSQDSSVHVTTAQKDAWTAKQDAISDLTDIRSGASAGATAVQPNAITDMATKTWVGQQGYLTQHQDISGKENNSNKVTTLSASSTDVQYPSAKCVWDIVGNVEATLQAIRGV